MKSVRLTADRNIDLQEILKGEPFSCFCSEDGMYRREFIEGDGKITVCIGEEFYFRTNSTLMVAMRERGTEQNDRGYRFGRRQDGLAERVLGFGEQRREKNKKSVCKHGI